MKLSLLKLSYLIFIFIFIYVLYFLYININSQNNYETIFKNEKLSEDFLINVPNEPKLIKKYLINYNFYSDYKIIIKDNKYIVEVKIYNPFAINYSYNQVIFENGNLDNVDIFSTKLINSINLVYKTKNPIYIEKETINILKEIRSIINFNTLEFIDDRRYDLYLDDGRKVMLPKLLDFKLINFLKKNFKFLINDNNFSSYLDLRNFHYDSIRMK